MPTLINRMLCVVAFVGLRRVSFNSQATKIIAMMWSVFVYRIEIL